MKIHAYGCSYTAGHGIKDTWDRVDKRNLPEVSKHSWPFQVGKGLGLPAVNHGYGGASNKEILYKILNTEFCQDDIVIVLWSYITRSCIINNNKLFRLSVNYDDKINRHWQKHFTSDENLHFEMQTNYSLANYYLKDKNIKTFNLMIRQDYWNLIEKNNNNIDNIYLRVNKPPYGMDGKHPHISEYTRFAEQLIKYFKDNKSISGKIIDK